ncbi:hypothetical protein KY092_08635 [Natronomonas gomsonensis]|uniref:hypothetical protein n=1 Tax=Natronomonas gomsonensis TaxID=1046043 RepID=UPI0020CA485C|nr:hypothetical protein [Natronomonas gomsonensis]MCY4730623.1 hypothetical protein [Natronomonas gomsonensis]
MADPQHYVVLEGLESNGRSDYTIQATGEIEMVDGMLGGVNVSRDADAPAQGSTQEGTVWAGADGYRVWGGIKSVDVANPDHVQLHVGEISGSRDPDAEECQVTVRAESVDFVSGQGPGEGALELTIESDIHGEQSETNSVRLPTGSSKNLGASIESFQVPQGRSLTKQLTTKVTEREVASDWFVGNDDYGDATTDIVLQCGEPKTVSQEVTISSDRGNEGKVRVNYTIGDLSR